MLKIKDESIYFKRKNFKKLFLKNLVSFLKIEEIDMKGGIREMRKQWKWVEIR